MFFFFFFFDNEKKLQDKQIELHYLSKTISYGIEKNDGNEFFDSYGVLENKILRMNLIMNLRRVILSD